MSGQREGHWLTLKGAHGFLAWACSECGNVSGVEKRHCPYCGARMNNAITGEPQTVKNRKDSESAFDDVNPKWLSLLLKFLSTDPPRREITVRAESGGKTVNVTYDPHDPEAAKAADVWRKALFADGAQFKAVAPVAVKDGDSVAFDGEKPTGEDERIKKAVQYTLHHPGTLPTAAECEFIRKHPETVKSDKPAVPEIIANPGNYGVTGFWWEDWADGRCFLRWRTEPGADAMKVVCLTGNPVWGFQVTYPCDGAEDVAVPENSFPWKPRFFKADSKAAAMRKIEDEIWERINSDDVRRLTWIRVKKPPKADLQQLDRAIRDLSDVVKDDQSGLHTYFDGVNMTYILECLKQYREAVGGA